MSNSDKRKARGPAQPPLVRRQAPAVISPPRFERGYGVLHLQHIGQADAGCNFDFLQSETRAEAAGKPEIH
ncbi:hypothetical protein [Achromobacter spanius]|uniref:hypothetical protein n=1 Tax=Achromobacter spanius TaxID=217203 RepID=UPI003D354E0E